MNLLPWPCDKRSTRQSNTTTENSEKGGIRSRRLMLIASLLTLLKPARAFSRISSFGVHRSSTPRSAIAATRLRMTTSASSGASGDKAPTMARTRLSPRVLETLDPCVVLMKQLVSQYAPLWEDKGGIFSLAQGIVYWEPPSTCIETLQAELAKPSNALHMYGPEKGIPGLVDALQTKISDENGMDNHHIMVTVGANQAYTNVVLACLPQNAKSVVFAPYYFNHVMAIQMTNGDDSVLVGPCTDDGIPDLDWLETSLRNNEQARAASNGDEIAMVTIVNPGNPTGVSIPKATLQRAVDLCRQHGVWLVLDCTYEYFTTDREHHQPIPTFPDDKHVLHIFSFSKSYSLAGYRCGYICLSKDSEDLWPSIMKIQDTIPIGPPRISQIVALGAMQVGKEWVYEKYDTLQGSRKAILDALHPLRTMGGSGAMYVMAQLPPTVRDDIEVCRRLVEDYGIATIPGTYCGFPGWIRVCYANLEPDICLVAAQRLRDGVQDIVVDAATSE